MARRPNRKSDLPYKGLLIGLADNLDASSLSDAEKLQISGLLRALAAGRTVDEALGISPSPGRPETADVFQRVWDVAILSNPKEHWGEGLSIEAAIERVAEAHHLSVHTVEENWKTWEGRTIRDFVRRNVVNPLALPLKD
jgi:hypothetical protein